MTPGCLVFANCVVAAMVLAAVVWLVARGARALLRLPRQALAVFFSLAAVAMLSAQKQGGQQHGNPPPRMVPSAPTVVPAAVDDEGPWMPANLAAVTNLCFWCIAKETNSVSLGLAWPEGADEIALDFSSKVKGGMGFLQAWKEAAIVGLVATPAPSIARRRHIGFGIGMKLPEVLYGLM